MKHSFLYFLLNKMFLVGAHSNNILHFSIDHTTVTIIELFDSPTNLRVSFRKPESWLLYQKIGVESNETKTGVNQT